MLVVVSRQSVYARELDCERREFDDNGSMPLELKSSPTGHVFEYVAEDHSLDLLRGDVIIVCGSIVALKNAWPHKYVYGIRSDDGRRAWYRYDGSNELKYAADVCMHTWEKVHTSEVEET